MRISLVPDGVYESYRQITPELLQSRGIRLLLSDLDYTLAPKSVSRPDQAVRDWLGRLHGVSKLPSHKALQAEIEQLTAEKNAHYNEYREKKARVKELHTVKSNLSQILQGEKDREKKHEHER